MTMDGNAAEPPATDPYRQTVEAVLAAVDVDTGSGLSRREAEKRLEQYGRNELAEEMLVPV